MRTPLDALLEGVAGLEHRLRMDRYLQILGWLCIGLGGAWILYSGISLIVGVGIAMTVAGLALCLKAWGSNSVEKSSRAPAASPLPEESTGAAVAAEVGPVGGSLRLLLEQEETLRFERSVQQRIWGLTRDVIGTELNPARGHVDHGTAPNASARASSATDQAWRAAGGGLSRGRPVRHAR